MAQYKTGSVTVTNGSQTVTGLGTLWSSEVSSGDIFTVVGENAWYEVGSVDSDTQITLSASYAGTSASGAAYAITRDFTTNYGWPYPQKGDIETASLIKRAFEDIDAKLVLTNTDGDVTVAGDITLSAGTANGVAYLNGSKVLTSGSALTFDGTTFGTTGALRVDGNTTLGNASTDTVTVNGYMGVGGAANSAIGVNVNSTTLSSTFPVGVNANPTAPATATTAFAGLYSFPRTAIAAFTVTNVAGVWAAGVSKGTGSTITNQHGLYIADQTQGTNNYGVTSLVSSGTNKWNIYASGTAQNYFAGNVGIGTSSPAYELDVASTGQADIRINSAASNDANLRFAAGGTNKWVQYYESSSGALKFYDNTASATRATLDASGNLGLGVTPSAWGTSYKAFQILGPSGTVAGALWQTQSNLLQIGNNVYSASGGDTYYSTAAAVKYAQTTSEHRWYTAPSGTAGNAISFSQVMTLDASGNLGIGTSSPRSLLSVRSSTGSVLTLENSSSALTTDTVIGKVDFYANDASTNGTGVAGSIGTYSEDIYGVKTYLSFSTRLASNPAIERARIDSSGNLLVGTTTVGSGTYADVNALVFYRNDGSLFVEHVTGTSSGTRFVDFSYAGSRIGSISQNGTTAVAYNTSSDYRLKDNIQDITGSGEFIDALQPRTWNWKVDGSAGAGFIAHELQAVSPSSVVGEKDAVDADGNPEYQAVEYGSAEVIAMLVAEVKSLRARLTAAGIA